MIKRILENENKNLHDLLDIAERNIDYLRVAVAHGKEDDIKESTVNVCQAMADIWNKKKYTIDVIEDMFKDFYIEKTVKGYTPDFFEGETHEDKMIAELLGDLNRKEKECEVLKVALRIVSNDRHKNY